MRNKSLLLCSLFLLFFNISSCEKRELYIEYQYINQNKWTLDQNVHFFIDSLITQPHKTYDVHLDIIHNLEYKYKNLWIYVDHNFQDSIICRDTIEFNITDIKDKWIGIGNGPTRFISLKLLSNVKLDTSKKYQANVTHAMADYSLKGIEKIGLKIY